MSIKQIPKNRLINIFPLYFFLFFVSFLYSQDYPPSWKRMELKGAIKSIRETTYSFYKFPHDSIPECYSYKVCKSMEFDSLGFMKKESRISSYDKKILNTVYLHNYDPREHTFKIDEYQFYSDSFSVEDFCDDNIFFSYTLDSNNQVINLMRYTHGGVCWQNENYTYNDSNQLIAQIVLEEDEKLNYANFYSYQYDNNGNIINKFHRFKKKFQMDDTTINYYYYDSSKVLIKEVCFSTLDYRNRKQNMTQKWTKRRFFPDSSSNLLFYRFEYTYTGSPKYTISVYFSPKQLISRKSYDDTDSLIYEEIHEYDSLNRIISDKYYYNNDRSCDDIRLYEYDNQNNLVYYKVFCGDQLRVFDRYEYDKYGNWIRKIEIDDSYGFRYDVENLIVREIEYYNE